MDKKNLLLFLLLNVACAQGAENRSTWSSIKQWWGHLFQGDERLEFLERQLNARIDQMNESSGLKIDIPHFHVNETVNATDDYGRTALHYLALYGTTPEDLKLARQLIINGANINAQDDSKVTPLMLAAQGNADFVKLLVDRGASINLRSKKKLTALSYARQTLDELKKNRTEENAVRIMQLEHIVKYLQEAQVRKSAHKRAASGALARELKEGDGEERMHEENEEEESEEAQADEEAYNKSGWTII